jgi:enoyl-CoA hydratase
MADKIICEKMGDATHITINRPDEGGIISDPMAAELAGMIDRAATESKYIVFRSAGPDFCIGRDPEGRTPGRPKDALDARARSEVVFNFYGAFRRARIPVVCAVQGRALGFGCAITSVCDITIAGEGAKFALPEMGHNIMPTMAMSSLVDRLGRKGALYMTYSTEEIDAATALAYGLVSRIAPDAELDAALEHLLATMLKAPLAATMAVKEYARHAFTTDIAAAIDFARNLHSTINSSSRLRK